MQEELGRGNRVEEREGEEAETVLQRGAEGISRERGSGLQDHREREKGKGVN